MAGLSTSHALFSWAGLFIALACCCGRSLAVGENYVGIGYNLLTGNPDGGDAAMGGVDPGLLTTRHILKLPTGSHALISQPRHSCGAESTLTTVYGAKSYQDKLSVGIGLKGSGSVELVKGKFSLSGRFTRMRSETNDKHQVFQDFQLVCNLGHLRFAEELSASLGVTVTDSFAADACHLPATYSQKPYMDFLDAWGTHMVEEVDIGTKVIQRSQATLTEFFQNIARTSGADLSVGGAYMGFGASLGVSVAHIRSRDSTNKTFGSHQVTLKVGTQQNPEPIHLTLVSIDTALQAKYWTHGISSFAARKLCDVHFKSDVIGTNLHRALNEYGAFKKAHPPTDPQLLIPVTWPRGTYGLYKTIAGCPSSKVTWHEGWRYEDNRDHIGSNHVSPGIHLAGEWPTNGDLKMYFCIKGDILVSPYDSDWPAGDYCLLKYGNCPKDFQAGWISWNDDNRRNGNSQGGTLPDGTFDSNTKIEYCCRNDGLPTHEIFLPPEKPFYLLRHTRGCQLVHGTTLSEETVQWDESVLGSSHRSDGSHPYDDGGSNHQLHFCYYTQAHAPLVG